jgi:CubicO group peptidase (beta-lactamase class C family)
MSFQIYIFFSLFIFIFSRTLDQSQLAQIDKLIEERLKSVKLDKFGIIIVNSSSIIHQKVFGEGITTKSHFPIASVTKSFTALGLLKLNIPLNQTIDKFNLGEYIKDDLAKQITVEELLSHSSGLDASSKKKVVEKGIFLYSNYGYGLLGKIIADQSKEKSYADFIKKNIMDELNMTESGLDYVNDFIDSYTNFFGSLSKYTNLESAYKKDDGFEIPAGFIRSSIEDMGKYLQGYFNINKDFLEKMGEPKTNINYNLYYGMGLFVRKKNGKYIYDHSGVIKSFLTHMYIYPDDDLAYFIFTNTNDGLCPGPFFCLFDFIRKFNFS